MEGGDLHKGDRHWHETWPNAFKVAVGAVVISRRMFQASQNAPHCIAIEDVPRHPLVSIVTTNSIRRVT
jgi:hypothetical protein